MKFLADFLIHGFGLIFSFLANRIGSRVAMIAMAVAAFAAALAALYATLKMLVSSLFFTFEQSGALGHWLVIGLNLVLPDNWDVCLSVKIATDLAVFLYQWNMRWVINQGVGG